MKITIKEQEIELKNTFRSMIIYENLMDKSFSPTGITEVIVYFYCVILASKKDISLLYDEFLDILDENPSYLDDFSKWIINNGKQEDHIKKNSNQQED